MLFNNAFYCSESTVLMVVKWLWQEKPKDSNINLTHCQFDNHKSQMESTDVTIAYA
jgi:hypothetical protein